MTRRRFTRGGHEGPAHRSLLSAGGPSRGGRVRRPRLARARWAVLLAAVSLAATASPDRGSSQERSGPHGMDAYRKAVGAMREKHYDEAVVHLEAVLAAAPSHPGVMAALARASLAAGKPEAALSWLDRAVSLGGGLEALRDDALVKLLETAGGRAIKGRADALRQPAGSMEAAFRVAERDLIPEGIAYDPATRSFFLGSIRKRKIVRIGPDGRVSDFVPSKRDGLLAVLGMKVDPRRRVLWAASEASESMIDGTPGETGRSAVCAYDLGSGKLIGVYRTPPEATRHLFNDLVVDSAGDVLVTDSEEGTVYAIPKRTGRLERLFPAGTWDYPNGIALSADQRTAYVAHAWGVSLVDRTTGRMRELEAPAGVTLAGIDGLVRDGRTLIAVQNGFEPMRVAAFELNDSGDRVESARTLARSHPDFDIPTTGVVAGGAYCFIANSQLAAFTPDGKIFPPERLHDVVVLRTPLR